MMCCNDNSEQAWRWELNKASKCETTFQKHFACFDITKTKLFLKKQFRDPKLKKKLDMLRIGCLPSTFTRTLMNG